MCILTHATNDKMLMLEIQKQRVKPWLINL